MSVHCRPRGVVYAYTVRLRATRALLDYTSRARRGLAGAALGVLAALLAQRAPASRHTAWALVATCCIVVAVDKTLDLQTAFYLLGQRTVSALDPQLGLRAHRDLVRVVLVVPAVAAVVLGGLWLARRNRAWGRAERLALSGIALVLVYVGLRLLPGMGKLVDGATDRVLELVALVLIAAGARLAWARPGSSWPMHSSSHSSAPARPLRWSGRAGALTDTLGSARVESATQAWSDGPALSPILAGEAVAQRRFAAGLATERTASSTS